MIWLHKLLGLINMRFKHVNNCLLDINIGASNLLWNNPSCCCCHRRCSLSWYCLRCRLCLCLCLCLSFRCRHFSSCLSLFLLPLLLQLLPQHLLPLSLHLPLPCFLLNQFLSHFFLFYFFKPVLLTSELFLLPTHFSFLSESFSFFFLSAFFSLLL